MKRWGRSKSAGFRQARWSDCIRIWRLRNHPDVRSGMRSTEPFGLLTHVLWMRRMMTSSVPRLFVAQGSSELQGVGRLDYDGMCAEIDVYVSPERRGFGIGSLIVQCLVLEAIQAGASLCWAAVKESNVASIKLFESCGFERQGSPESGLVAFWKPLQ